MTEQDDKLFCRGADYHDTQRHPCNFCHRMQMPVCVWDPSAPVQAWLIDRPLDSTSQCNYIKLKVVH